MKHNAMALGLLLTTTLAMGSTVAFAELAPVPRFSITADNAPESLTAMLGGSIEDTTEISVPGAAWLQLRFDALALGPEGKLVITTPNGDVQNFTQDSLTAWDGKSAAFNGAELSILLEGVSGDVTIAEVMVGLPGATPEIAKERASETFFDFLGVGDMSRYMIDDVPPKTDDGSALPPDLEFGATIESICTPVDKRVSSAHPYSGRLMPVGCTGWLIPGNLVLTAGHCVGSSMGWLEFNVPRSYLDGTTRPTEVKDQYPVIRSSVVSRFTGVGNDWAVFRVAPNTETNLLPSDAQGGHFEVSNTAEPTNVRITGFGVDGPAPKFGNPPPRNGDNQTQQTHAGRVVRHTSSGSSSGTLKYRVDTQGGNSGSPVFAEDSNEIAIGIHTNGGCATTGANAGTSFRNKALWNAIQPKTN